MLKYFKNSTNHPVAIESQGIVIAVGSALEIDPETFPDLPALEALVEAGELVEEGRS